MNHGSNWLSTLVEYIFNIFGSRYWGLMGFAKLVCTCCWAIQGWHNLIYHHVPYFRGNIKQGKPIITYLHNLHKQTYNCLGDAVPITSTDEKAHFKEFPKMSKGPCHWVAVRPCLPTMVWGPGDGSNSLDSCVFSETCRPSIMFNHKIALWLLELFC